MGESQNEKQVIKMMEALPETKQDQVVEHLREYLADLYDELEWDAQFKKTQKQLLAVARRAKKKIAKGQRFSSRMIQLHGFGLAVMTITNVSSHRTP